MLAHQEEVQIFTILIEDIDKQLALDQKCCLEKLSLKVNASKHLEEICQKLPSEYYKYLNVFNCSQASKLLPQS